MEINDHKVSKARGEATMARWERKHLCNYSTYTRIATKRHRKTVRHATRLALRSHLG
jgi:hypothetical protein